MSGLLFEGFGQSNDNKSMFLYMQTENSRLVDGQIRAPACLVFKSLLGHIS